MTVDPSGFLRGIKFPGVAMSVPPPPAPEPELCLVCGEQADSECAACGAPLCDDDAQLRDFDRYCPGGRGCLLP